MEILCSETATFALFLHSKTENSALKTGENSKFCQYNGKSALLRCAMPNQAFPCSAVSKSKFHVKFHDRGIIRVLGGTDIAQCHFTVN